MVGEEEKNRQVENADGLSNDKPVDSCAYLNGDGKEYTPEQIQQLREYLSMLADLVIEIYYDE